MWLTFCTRVSSDLVHANKNNSQHVSSNQERTMSQNAKRLSMVITEELDELIDDLAREAGTSRTDVVRRALAVMKAFKQQKQQGRDHIGFVSDPSKLDVEVVNVL